MLKRLLLAALSLALVGTSSSSALAAGTASKSGDIVRWVAGPTEKNDTFDVYAQGNEVQFFYFVDGDTPPPRGSHTVPGPGCAYALNPPDPNNPDNTMVVCPLDSNDRVIIETLGGADQVSNSLEGGIGAPEAGSFPLEIDLGPGDDYAKGNDGNDLIRGGDGSDTLIGLDGNDRLEGGAGSDTFEGRSGADELVGGDGIDHADMTWSIGNLSVTIDGVANDGSITPAENDNVFLDVEDVTTTSGNDIIVGSAASNNLVGAEGNDKITGGGGFDILDGFSGNDELIDRDGISDRLDCGDGTDKATVDNIDAVSFCETADASDELVNDVDKDGAGRPADCNDRDPAIHPSAADPPDDGIDQDCSGADATIDDRDGDGSPKRFDCDDTNKAIKPGAKEIYGNKVDEDCNGRSDPLQVLTTAVRWSFTKARGGVRVNLLATGAVRKGTTVEVHCKGKRCPFKKKTVKVKKDTSGVELAKRMKLRRLRGGIVLEVWIVRDDSLGRVFRFTVRSKGLPRQKVLCKSPSQSKPGSCK